MSKLFNFVEPKKEKENWVLVNDKIKWKQPDNRFRIYYQGFWTPLKDEIELILANSSIPEEVFAKVLIELNPPIQIEEMMISQFNSSKREYNLLQDKVKNLKNKIIQTYNQNYKP